MNKFFIKGYILYFFKFDCNLLNGFRGEDKILKVDILEYDNNKDNI